MVGKLTTKGVLRNVILAFLAKSTKKFKFKIPVMICLKLVWVRWIWAASHTIIDSTVSNSSTLEIAFKGSSADSQQGAVCRRKRYSFLEVKH
jgi:hypothetical protein